MLNKVSFLPTSHRRGTTGIPATASASVREQADFNVLAPRLSKSLTVATPLVTILLGQSAVLTTRKFGMQPRREYGMYLSGEAAAFNRLLEFRNIAFERMRSQKPMYRVVWVWNFHVRISSRSSKAEKTDPFDVGQLELSYEFALTERSTFSSKKHFSIGCVRRSILGRAELDTIRDTMISC